MKKTLLFLAAAASFGTASAQKMGDIFVYGSIGYQDNRGKTTGNGTSVDTKHDRIFSFAPGIGYQLSEHLGVGLAGEMNASKGTAAPSVAGANETSASETYVGPFVRYTRNLSNLFFVFGQFNAMYLRTNTKQTTAGVAGTEIEGNGVYGRLRPALGINLSRSLSVIGSFGDISYKHLTENAANSSSSNNTDYKTDNLNATFGDNFTLTVQWNFGTGMRRRGNMEPMDDTRRMDTSDGEDMPKRRRGGRDNDN